MLLRRACAAPRQPLPTSPALSARRSQTPARTRATPERKGTPLPMKTIWSFDLGKASNGEGGAPPASTRAEFFPLML